MTLSEKVNVAVERIRMFDPIATGLMDEPYGWQARAQTPQSISYMGMESLCL